MSILRVPQLLCRIGAIAAAGALALAAAPAVAGDTVSVAVSANVIGVCKFFGGPYSVTIANSGSDIDPSLATTATGNASIEYRCSNGTSPGFSIPSATLTLANGPATMDATITLANTGAGTGMGNGQGKTLTVTGTILQAEFQNKAPGTYTNNVVVTLTP